jgi:hypothetical protein
MPLAYDAPINLDATRGRRAERPWLWKLGINVYRVNPDGRVAERWGYVGDQAAFDDLFADA